MRASGARREVPSSDRLFPGLREPGSVRARAIFGMEDRRHRGGRTTGHGVLTRAVRLRVSGRPNRLFHGASRRLFPYPIDRLSLRMPSAGR